MTDPVYQARDILIAHVKQHEAECRDPQCREVANVLAFLAHSIGATDDDLKAMPRLLLRYDLNCKGCGSARDSPTPTGADRP